MYPAVLQNLLPERRETWCNSPKRGGKTRRDIVAEAIRQLVDTRRFDCEGELTTLIKQEFGGESPQRMQTLLEDLRSSLGGAKERAVSERVQEWRTELSDELRLWINQHIFDYTSFTRLLVEHWASALRLKSAEAEFSTAIMGVGEDISSIVQQAFTRGQEKFVREGQTEAFRFGKARNGIARLTDSILAAAKEFANERGAADRQKISQLVAAAVWGVMDGFGRVRFLVVDRTVDANVLFSGQQQAKSDLLRVLHLVFAHRADCPAWVREWARTEGLELATLEALWRSGTDKNRQTARRCLPSPSGANVQFGTGFKALIEFDIEADQDQPIPLCFKAAAFLSPLSSGRPAQEVLSTSAGPARYSLLLARQLCQDIDPLASTLLTQIPALPRTAAEPAVEALTGPITAALRAVVEGHSGVTVDDLKNYAIDFPLDEKARISGAYLVRRPSATEYVRRVLQAPGLYLSCSMRRSGKTTAFQPELIERAGLPASAVVVESCRKNGLPLRFFDWIKQEMWHSRRMITAQLVVDWFESNLGESRLLVLDEYESLFSWISEEARSNRLAKSDFFDPLLDGIVEASDRWSILFIGLNPRAARIFMQDNPVAPRLQTSSFPLFQHSNNQGSSEFADLLERVVTRNFEIEQLLIDRLHFETAGHPHFAVSVTREFIDWVLKRNRLRESRDRRLRADWWDDFAADRLLPLAMMESRNFAVYADFHNAWRQSDDDPWLSAISRLAEHIGNDRIERSRAEDFLVASTGSDVGSARQMLVDASRANFVCIDAASGSVGIMVPLYGRLARGWR